MLVLSTCCPGAFTAIIPVQIEDVEPTYTLCVSVLQIEAEQADAGRLPQQAGPVLEVHVGV